jgi:hypothetical protein
VRAIVAACALVSGCSLFQPIPKSGDSVPLGPAEILSAHTAQDAITVGKSTKADVRAALGEAIVVGFDSGYEVWVYRERLREKLPPPATELVLLFEPSGVLARTRIR